jgi:hypothetical protein
MRALKTLAFAFLLITAPAILESCCRDYCGCGDFKRMTFDIADMTLTPMSFATPTTTELSTPEVFAAVFLEVELEAVYIPCTSLISTSGSVLFAWQPPPVTSNQLITDVNIISNNAIESDSLNAPAGSSLNSIFTIWGKSSYGFPITSIIQNGELDTQIYFRSPAALTRPQTHVFTIVIVLDDGRTFKLVTPSLELI